MQTIGEAVSRIRTLFKAVKQDAFLTDRFLYSLIMKPAKMLLRRQDATNKLMRFQSIIQTLDFVELIDVDKAQAGCFGVYAGCTFKRSKLKLPDMLDGYYGPLIRAVTSLDISQQLTVTYPTTFEQISRQKTFRYNKNKYYWILDGYLYCPNVDWDAVRVEGIFENSVAAFNCADDDEAQCMPMQENTIGIPDYLFSEIEQSVKADLGITLQIPSDTQQDNKHPLR